MGNLVLQKVLEPLSTYFDDTTVIEMRMSRPGEIITDVRGKGLVATSDPVLTQHLIEEICWSLANQAGLNFDPDSNPKLSTTLQQGHRFECLVGPSVRSGLSLAIRCKHPFDPSWEDIGISGSLQEYIENIIAVEKNIIISGATNTGKTTFLNKLLTLLPNDRRVVSVEDTPELHMEPFWNGTSLLAARDEGSSAGLLSYRQIYDHLVRITPDHIIFGEISTGNAFAALGALNSGVTGFVCTIHAESPKQAINRKFEQNIAWSGQDMPRVSEFMAEMVGAVIQIKRDHQGWRRITDIWEPDRDRM
ncbi:CpaF/VirB11 family protein, partial [Kiloniella laminariae]|uniref:CpaF/VirB11 family protein n=1 Tax=Kiloniella laminariae TaxID=454162 RepID=UPI00035E82DB